MQVQQIQALADLALAGAIAFVPVAAMLLAWYCRLTPALPAPLTPALPAPLTPALSAPSAPALSAPCSPTVAQ